MTWRRLGLEEQRPGYWTMKGGGAVTKDFPEKYNTLEALDRVWKTFSGFFRINIDIYPKGYEARIECTHDGRNIFSMAYVYKTLIEALVVATGRCLQEIEWRESQK